PLSMSFDIRDSAVYPDTSRVAEAMKTIWTSTPWGSKTTLDGVVLIDPVVLQELVGATGNITLPDGRVLTGSNTAQFLLNTVYIDYPVSQQDGLFQLVAESAMSSAFSNMRFSKLMTISKIMSSMAEGRHLSVYAFDTSTQKSIAAAGFTASTPNSEQSPSVGVYVTEQSPSKMDWYVHRTSRVVRQSCNADGSQTYQVTYTMKNTMTSKEASSLSTYITGNDSSVGGGGAAIEKTLIYPPKGGSIKNLSINGTSTAVKHTTLNGKEIYASVITMSPGADATISFTVTTSTKSTADLRLDQTPMGWVNSGIVYDTASCEIKKK
ncbi:DUF4012 domain-containing protein, partial [uncultured Bifidobacterium sp.]|uniref:DUF4012 domain-containing protein n=1 Tax=uncultured Bifidobacterium sp. TaxID=165187 RepID=UPI00261639E1